MKKEGRFTRMRLSALISNGLVLQRNKENYIWGSECEPGREVSVTIEGKQVTGYADEAGRFKVTLPNVNAGGPYELKITAGDNSDTVTIKDVMCGDVFLLAGQSNIELPLCRCLDMYEEEILNMNLPDIHYFEVVKEYAFDGPVDELYEGVWQQATQKDNILLMSALGVFFARFHQEKTGVPVGLIQTGVGGTHIESYLSEEHVISVGKLLREEALKRGEDISSCNCNKNDSCKVCYEKQLAKYKDSAWVKQMAEEEVKKQQDWSANLDGKDIGLKEHWEKKTSLFEEGEEVKYVTAPGRFTGTELEPHRGSVWLLKTVDIPRHWLDKEIRVYLGTLIDADTTYVNGVKIGNTEYRYPPRRYRIPAGILHEGENTIVIRLIANARTGGFVEEMPYYLSLGDEKISLEGKWQYKIGGTSFDETTGEYDQFEKYYEFEDITFLTWKPTAQYNRMVYPLRNLRFSSVLFYQGESNANHAWEYEYLMIDMVKCLRELFNDDLAFGFVELPYFGGEDAPEDSTEWDDLRAAQERAAAKIDNCTIADIYDLGFKNELHPQTKKEAAKLLYDKMSELMGW